MTYKPINLEMLQQLAEKEKLISIDAEILIKYGFINKYDHYKILGNGAVKEKIDVFAHAFSASARIAIEKLEGKATIINIHA